MSESLEMAWAAGFFDGEGTSGCSSFGKNRSLYLTVSQADKSVLERFVSAIGVGVVRGPFAPKWPGKKPMFRVSIQRNSAVILVMDALEPYLCQPKIEQWRIAKSLFDSRILARGAITSSGYTHCKNGHVYSDAFRAGKNWRCHICRLESSRRYERKKRAMREGTT